MAKRSFTSYGIRIALALPFVAMGALAVLLAFTYDGTCGGLMPWLAAARKCTLAEYLSGFIALLALIAVKDYWPALLALLALPIAVGHVLDRRRHRAAQVH